MKKQNTGEAETVRRDPDLPCSAAAMIRAESERRFAEIEAQRDELLAACKEMVEVNKHLMQVMYILATCGGWPELIDSKYDGFGVRAQKAIDRAEGRPRNDRNPD